MNRLTALRILAVTAIIAGLGLIAWPQDYNNPAYRVLFDVLSARQAGVAWVAVGVLVLLVRRAWTVAIFGAAILAWGLGFASAALSGNGNGLSSGRSGSPLGWVWYIGLGCAVLLNLVRTQPETRV